MKNERILQFHHTYSDESFTIVYPGSWKQFISISWLRCVSCSVITLKGNLGYEPAGLTVHPPSRMIDDR